MLLEASISCIGFIVSIYVDKASLDCLSKFNLNSSSVLYSFSKSLVKNFLSYPGIDLYAALL